MIGAAITIVARFGFWFGGGDNRNNPLAAIGAIAALLTEATVVVEKVES